MNIKEAYEHLQELNEYPNLKNTAMAHYAKGFLKAVEKMKPLVEALQAVWKDKECENLLIVRTIQIEKALSHYRKEVLGELE